MNALSRSAAALATLAALSASSFSQYAERPALAGQGTPDLDVSGRSVKNKRIRAVHTTNPELRGGTAYFFEKDPYLAYQLGRNLNFREFRERDGVFSALVSNLAGPMPDGTTAKITANNQTSCSGCHNLPQGNPGGGANFHKDSGLGRNSPHYYGAGIVEMLAIQIRQAILDQADTNDDGWISAAEGMAAGSVQVMPAPGGTPIDYGSVALDGGQTGSPELNNIFRVWYVDANGVRVEGATEVDGVTTFGFNFNMIVWGFGQGPGRAALNPTNRAFLWDPYKAHGGLDSHDPSTLDDPEGDGVSAPTLAGAIQFPATHQAPDPGLVLDPLGFSRDDPDGDGYLTEISEGDLDLAEWFMLNAPRPAFAGTPQQFQQGLSLMTDMGCTECHVARWRIRPEDGSYAGDRRFFDLAVSWNAQVNRFEGSVVPLYTKVGDTFVRDLDAFTEVGFFSDLKHHDMGVGFQEIDFGGNVNTLWRTPPLWGVGSSFPWGHDGASLTLEHAIQRHDGEGAASKAAWNAASPVARATVLRFLNRLQLYDIETLPTDVDGDAQISVQFVVAGRETGYERFNPEWLFRTPVAIQGPYTNSDGVVVRSNAALNLERAYGEILTLRMDQDDDGWPDVWDNAPLSPGYKDGVN